MIKVIRVESKEIKPKVRFSETHRIKEILRRYKLHTVCEESLCPNISECFGRRHTATFLIMGRICTRYCSFCAIEKSKNPPPLDPNEPENLKNAVKEMGIRYVVLTSPTRDDLEDGGAKHISECIKTVKEIGCKVEILCPDLKYEIKNLDIVLSAKPDVFAHNVETVPELYQRVRPKGDFEKSLELLKYAKSKGFITKTSIILGMGEKDDELKRAIEKIAQTGCDIITFGQYFQPSLTKNGKVYSFIPEEKWEFLREFCKKLGFKAVFAGPNVRSSYLADIVLDEVEKIFGTCKNQV